MAIGAEFTPEKWARWLVKEFNLVEKFMQGASFLDPTAGEGSLLLALLREAREQNNKITAKHLQNLYAVEKEKQILEVLDRNFRKEGYQLPANNMLNHDFVLDQVSFKVDYIISNPPWINFGDLPASYKEKVRPVFADYKLIENKQTVLLGKSRVDLAALVISRALKENLKTNGQAYFFCPLSLFFNDGSHERFRHLLAQFSLDKLYNLTRARAFEKIATNYGLAAFSTGKATSYPLPYVKLKQTPGRPEPVLLEPLYDGQGAGLVDNRARVSQQPPPLPESPRQGINTCGANRYFIFKSVTILDAVTYQVETPVGMVKLPARFLYPLADSPVIKEETDEPSLYILLTHDASHGKALSANDIKKEPYLWRYLEKIKPNLIKRRGTMIQSQIKRGLWWSLFGIGPYSFTPYKVIWRAFGATSLEPVILSHYKNQPWQANQALQAYIPCHNYDQAVAIRDFLKDKEVSDYLHASSLPGSKSWAQPGRIKRLFEK